MTLLWTTPREWKANDAITKERLNDISNNLTYLYSPSRGIATVRNGTNQTTTSTTPVDLDASNFGMSVELSGLRDVYVELKGLVSNATLAAVSRFDVYMDATTYLSSLTGTQLTLGLASVTQYVANHLLLVNLRFVIPRGVLSAGVHTFQPRWWVSAGTSTWYEATAISQFEVGEI